ncbi:MAG: hypothetical protein HYY87_03370 [Candidatus Levybacteria bacterium]|nr:hypothetical protein [Candidatus Levybacteria bacterium]MBI3092735.1 hypothetical protein [Candidatus Levybacteria bacterium]
MLLLFGVQAVVAQEQDVEGAAISPTPTPIKYELPYPGLLPDSPLYFLKTGRDRIINFLISDPLKKAEFNLLQADKRLQAGVYLFKKQGKERLAESTISKGENYFDQAIAQAQQAQQEGRKVSSLGNRLFLAAQKHQEVLKSLEAKSPKEIKGSITALKEKVANFEKKVDLLRLK